MSLRPETAPSWFHPSLIAAGIVATAIVASTAIVAHAWRTPSPTPEGTRTIEVQTSVTRHLHPDHFSWTLTVHAHDTDRAAAVTQLHDAVEHTRAYLLAHGLASADLVYAPLAVEAEQESSTNGDGETTEVDTGSLDASQEITVETKDVARGQAAFRGAALAGELPDVDVGTPTCTADGIEAFSNLLISEARRDTRAKAMAEVSDYGGAGLGRLVSITSDAAEPGSSCDDLIVTATSTASYELE
jgi:hypothetical protein